MTVSPTATGRSTTSQHRFQFQACLPPSATQEEVYHTTAEPLVDRLLDGFNAAVVAYGQTGAGKSFTMLGDEAAPATGPSASAGVVPRLLCQLFDEMRSRRKLNPELEFAVGVSFVEIYMERVREAPLLKQGVERWINGGVLRRASAWTGARPADGRRATAAGHRRRGRRGLGSRRRAAPCRVRRRGAGRAGRRDCAAGDRRD